ncbi:MAG TPA: hypothetical protein VFF06_29780 [Polyangia bacterium]|nr:hypothetical protein [Polyangia bacterium]
MGVAGCQPDLDTNRKVDDYGSFGAAVYRESCQRLAYTGQLAQYQAGTRSTLDVAGSLGHSVCVDDMPPPADAPAKLPAIVKEKASFTAVVDAILPQPFLQDLQDFMVSIVPLNDDGTMETAITTLATLLGTMHDDPDFSPALARLAQRAGYRPTKTAAGLVHTIVEYPNIDMFLDKTLAMIAPGGTAETEFKAVLDAASHELRASVPVPNPNDPERTLKLALDLFLSTHPDLSTGTPRPLVARDYRGVAAVPTNNGQVPAPFVDKDNDGYPDIDSMGRFVDASGAPLELPPPFVELGTTDTAPRDAQGRALTAANATSTIYSYLNLDGTVIGGLTRETQQLMDPTNDKTFGLVYGLAAMLGPRQSQTKMYMDPTGGMIGALTYQGFDTSQAAALDLAHAFIQLLGDPNADQTFQATATLIANHESETARVVGAMIDASDRGKNHPEAQVPANSTIYDELQPLIVRILHVPGLAQDIVRAMTDPRHKGFAPMIARMMQANDQLDFDHNNAPVYGINQHSLDNFTPVDRNKFDVDYNRSLMQRIAHLIHDTNGLKFCNKDGATTSPLPGTYAKCDLFEIDDLALFFLLSMSSQKNGGNASAVNGANFCNYIKPALVRGAAPLIIEGSLGTNINGFTCTPTPEALTRSLFLRQTEKSSFLQNTTDDILCVDGDKFIDVHDKSLVAWEMKLPNNPSGNPDDTFYDAVQPLIDAFARHDECIAYDAQMRCTKTQNAGKIFLDIFSMLHEHWSSPNGSYFGHTYQPVAGQPRYAHTDNIASYEPLMAEVFSQADLMPALNNLAPTMLTFTVDDSPTGQPALPVLINTASYLFDPAAAATNGITYRNGMASTVMSDGTTPVPQATPYYLMADAFAAKRAQLSAAGAAGGSWKVAVSGLVDQMLSVTNTNGTYQFSNRRFRAVTLKLVDFIRGRLAAHATAGDLDAWTHKTLTQDLTDVLGGPTFAALGDFVAKIEGDPDARTQLYGLLSYLVDEAANDLVFQTALTTLADQVQMFLDDPDLIPIARVLGSAMDPSNGTVDAQLTLIKKARDKDSKKALLTILRNLYHQDTAGNYPASTLADVLSTINRAQPGADGPLDGNDYKTMFGDVRDFLMDESRGYLRFLHIVQSRGPHP